MNIYIINLKRSIERRKAITTQCDNLGLKYEVIEAIDGRLFSPAELELHAADINYADRPNEIGCALSHLKVYEKLMESQSELALVLEDDALLSEGLKECLDAVELANNKSVPEVTLLTATNKLVDRPKKLEGLKSLVYPVYHATTAHGYIINRQAARNLRDNLYPIWITADKWAVFDDYSFISVSAVVPPPISLTDDSLNSTIVEAEDTREFIEHRKIMWKKVMDKRPLSVKLKHRVKRIFLPMFYKIIDMKSKI